MIFRAYLDESDDQQTSIFMVGGFWGKAESFDALEPRWKAALPDYVRYFHATDCFSGHEQWQGIDIPARVELLNRLTDLILEYDVKMIGYGLDTATYKEFAPKPKNNEFLGNKYCAPFSGIVELACQLMDNHPYPRDIAEQCAFVIERNDYTYSAQQTILGLKQDEVLWWRNRIGTDTYGDKDGPAAITLLQLADLGAFLEAKYLANSPNGKIPWRPYFEKLLCARRAYRPIHADARSLRVIAGIAAIHRGEVTMDDL